MMLRSDIFRLIVFLSLTTTATALLIPTATIQHQTSFPKCWYTTTYQRSNQSHRRFHLYLQNGSNESDDDLKVEGSSSIWNPNLRKIMGGVAAFGALETMYLTYSDLHVPGEEGLQNHLLFCSSSSDSMGGSLCNSVLSSPYAHIPGTDIPIAAVGAMAYVFVFGLAVVPLRARQTPLRQSNTERVDDDSVNRVLLLATTTTMGVFSVFLMSILFNVLHQTCGYCIVSAVCSIGLMSLSWFGTALPNNLKKEGLSLSFSGGVVSMLAALVLVMTNVPSTDITSNINGVSTTSTLLATTDSLRGKLPSTVTAQEPPLLVDQVPPTITTESSSTALQLAADLQKLDARFYGAYWCSHCYDQKQAFGKQAMQRIPYVECSREGRNEQAGLCKEKKIPGYPTWEISGKLYPGEKALDEIREIVVNSMVQSFN